MAPVRIATSPWRPDRDLSGPEADFRLRAEGGGVTALRFGDEVVHWAGDADWRGFAESALRSGLPLRERPGVVDRERLHVVVQKGRLFQREHPEAPVLLDKGRFLLVEMAPARARELGDTDVPCFSLRPVEALEPVGAEARDRIVFAWRDSATNRASMASAPDARVQALVDRVSRATFEADLVRLVQLPTRLSTSAHYATACAFVAERLSALGYQTSRQSITVDGAASENVVARRDGSGPAPRGLVLVTAHLDSINQEDGPGAPAPGADDDGSGSAGVIAIARALEHHHGSHDLQLVLFGGEEQGLFGSKHFVASMSSADRARVRAVVNMDMIGTLNTFEPTVLLEGAPLSQGMIDGLGAAAATYTALAVQTSLNAFNSDHVSFIREGMPAVLTIEGADSANDEVHTARDTLEHINLDLAAEILRMNVAFVAQALDTE